MRAIKKKLFHQLLSIILCIVLVLGYTPVSVSVDTGIVYGDESVTYVDENGETQICDNSTAVTANDTIWGTEGTTSWYVVTETIVIGSEENISRITVIGDVHLILADGASLTVNGGIGLNDENSHITIYGQVDGTGELITQNVVDGSAGIGSNLSLSAGTITINGGIINTQGGVIAPGIGSGTGGGHCGVITINGGNVTSIGTTNAPGIGNSNNGSCEAIEITGGEITATGGNNGAGIGSGWDAIIGTITISGGKINAQGGNRGAGIGSGGQNEAVCEKITITGGEIIATGGRNASGIGAGESAFYREIIISGGKITAIGINYGNGIGGKYGAEAGIVNITGGEVTATGGENGYGFKCDQNKFSLSGNAVVYTTYPLTPVGDKKKGILFVEKSGTVYGEMTIPREIEIPAEYTLTILEDSSLIIESESVINNNGQIINNGQVINNGPVINKNVFTNNNLISNTGIFSNMGTFSSTGTIECRNHYKTDSLCSDLERGCDLCGYECVEPHTGEYTASANVITVDSCNSNAEKCAYENGTLTLTAEDRIYTGEVYTGASVSGDNFPIREEDVTILYYDSQGNQMNGTPINTGTYTAKVTVGNVIAEDYFVISKAERDLVTVNVHDYTYGDPLGGPTLTGWIMESPSIVYYYNTTNSTNGGMEYKDAPGNTLEPGTYYMYAVIGESENYWPYTTEPVAFTVKPATLKSIIADVNQTYDGKAHGITVAGFVPEKAVIRYGTEKEKYTLTESPAYTDVGTYTVYYQISVKGYYTVEDSATITIGAASIKNAKVVLGKTSYDYDGIAKTPSVTVKVDDRTLVNGTDYTVSYKNNKNIGTATVTITGKGNYTGVSATTFTIKAKAGKTFTSGKYKYKVTSSSTVAFNGIKSSSTTKVVIPKTVKYGGKTFKVTSLADNALKSQEEVTSVAISGNITKIGKNAFYGCKKLKTIIVETKSLKSVGSKAFKGILSTATVKVPTSKYASYKKLFDGKGLGKKNSIVINPVKGDTFTSGNNKYKVTSTSAVTFTGLKNTKKTEMSIPKMVTFGGKTFYVTAIAEKALKGITKLKKVTIGENVKTIGASAFYGCKNLKTITIKSTKLTSAGKNALKGISAKATIKVPPKKLSAYKKLLKNKGQGKKVTIVKY